AFHLCLSCAQKDVQVGLTTLITNCFSADDLLRHFPAFLAHLQKLPLSFDKASLRARRRAEIVTNLLRRQLNGHSIKLCLLHTGLGGFVVDGPLQLETQEQLLAVDVRTEAGGRVVSDTSHKVDGGIEVP